MAGPEDGEAPAAGGAAVAQAAQRQYLAVAEVPVYVGVIGPEPHGHLVQVRPALAGPGVEALGEAGLGRLRRAGRHPYIFARASSRQRHLLAPVGVDAPACRTAS